jgi:hypothetical protein
MQRAKMAGMYFSQFFFFLLYFSHPMCFIWQGSVSVALRVGQSILDRLVQGLFCHNLLLLFKYSMFADTLPDSL